MAQRGPGEGVLFVIPVSDGIWAAGVVVWAHEEGHYRAVVLDRFWDHEPTADEAADGPVWRRPGARGLARKFMFSGRFPFKQIGRWSQLTADLVGPTGAKRLAKPDDLSDILQEYWRQVHERSAWLREQRLRARNLGIEWVPPPQLAGWRFETPLAELAAGFNEAEYAALSRTFLQLWQAVSASSARDGTIRVAFEKAVNEFNAFHAETANIDPDAGELLLRRMTQLGHCVGLTPGDISKMASHRTWPAGPMESLNLSSTIELPTKAWRRRRAADETAYPEEGIRAVEDLLQDSLTELQDVSTSLTPAEVESWVRRLVHALNNVDSQFGLIDSAARDELVLWIIAHVGPGLSGDPTSAYRTW